MENKKYATLFELLNVTEMLTEDTEIIIHLQGKGHYFKIDPKDIKIIRSSDAYFPDSDHDDNDNKKYLQIGSI